MGRGTSGIHCGHSTLMRLWSATSLHDFHQPSRRTRFSTCRWGRQTMPFTKTGKHYFPALVNWSVVENNVSGFYALCSGACPRDVPVHLKGGPRAPLAARARKCWPPFRGGLRPPHGEKRKRGKTFGGPCQASVAARNGVLFFILHH